MTDNFSCSHCNGTGYCFCNDSICAEWRRITESNECGKCSGSAVFWESAGLSDRIERSK